MQLELRDRVIVATRHGDLPGLIREPWHGPVTGPSFVVDLDDGRWLIAPVSAVRRSSESEA